MEDVRIIQIKSSFSFAVSLVDSFTGLTPKESGIEVKLGDIPQKPVRKSDGTFVFSNIEKGDHQLTIRSKLYFEEVIYISSESLLSHKSIVIVTLKPKPNYSFLNQTTMIRFMLKTGNQQMVKDAEITAMITNESGSFAKLAQEKVEQNEQEISLTGKVYIGDEFYIRDKNQHELEFCRIIEMVDGLSRYRLEEPLQFSYARGAAFIPIIRTKSTERGEVVIPLRNYRLRKIELTLRILYQQRTIEQQIEVEDGVVRNLGNLIFE